MSGLERLGGASQDLSAAASLLGARPRTETNRGGVRSAADLVRVSRVFRFRGFAASPQHIAESHGFPEAWVSSLRLRLGVARTRSLVVVQFDVARASCACLHGRDARATLKLLHYPQPLFLFTSFAGRHRLTAMCCGKAARRLCFSA